MSDVSARLSRSNIASGSKTKTTDIIWSHDENGGVCVNIPNCITGEDLKIAAPESVVTGIKFPNDDSVYAPDANGCITLPADKFATGVISEGGSTLTLTVDGVDGSVDICLDPIKGAVIIDAQGAEQIVPIVDGMLQFEAPEPLCWGFNEDGCPIVNIGNCITGEELVLDFVKSVTGNVVDNTDPLNPVVTAVASVTGAGVDNADPLNPVIASSSTTPSADGVSHVITTDDGVDTTVCLNPVKDVLDPLGVSTVTDGVAQLSDYLQITESADGSAGTVTNTLTGDSCTFLKTVEIPADVRVVGYDMVETVNAAGDPAFQFTITMSDGTSFPAGPVIDMDKFGSVADNGDGTGTVIDPVTGLPCTFIKSTGLTSNDGSVVINGTDISVVHPDPVIVESTDGSANVAVTATGFDVSITHPDPKTVQSADGSVVVTPTATGCNLSVTHPGGTVVESSDDSVTVTQTATGYDVVVTPFTQATVTDNLDGTGTVTDVNANSCDFLKGPITQSTAVPSANGLEHIITTADGIVTPVCLDPVKDVLDPLGLSVVVGGVATLPDYLEITESGDGSTGTVTNTLTGASCTFLKEVTLSADVTVASYDMETVPNADGSTSYQFTITLTDGTVLPAGPVIDMDKFGAVVDNGDGTGSTTDPVSGLLVPFQKPVTSVDSSITVSGADLSVNFPVYKDWAGNDIDPATSQIVNGRNPVDQIRCRDNAIRHRFCDNSFVWTNSQVRRSSTGFGFTEYTNADLQDAIDNNNGLLQEVCAGPLDVPFCGGFVSLFGNLAFETNAPDGTLFFELEKSVDGGATWTSFTSNGQQVVRPREPSGFGSEIVFPHKDIENVIPFAANQITPCYRLYIRTIGVPMSTGVIRVTASGMCAYINNEVCCDADGNAV